MKLGDILSGIEAAVNRQWPDAPVYRDYKPKDFQRPSFLLEGGPITAKEMGGSQRKVTAQARLTCFTEVDAYGHSDTAELLETAESLMELFQGGYITIGERNPHVTEVTGDYGFDYAEVTAKLEFYEQSVSKRAAGDLKALMEQFHTKFEKER